jgi:hypothetical protein
MKANHVTLLPSRSFIIIAVVLSRFASCLLKRKKPKPERYTTINPRSCAFKNLNSSESQRKHPKRLKLFFDHIGLTGAAAAATAGAGDNDYII